MSKSPHVVVIGAGVAGLAAARHLRAAGVRVTLIERGAVVGGRVRTVEVEGCRIELGAEFLASFYTRTLALIGELGLTHELRRIPRSAAILRDGRLYPLWPSPLVAFTALITTRQKLTLAAFVGTLIRHRPLLDLHAFHHASPVDDASVSTYARASLSEELLEYVLQPPLAGIFYWTPEQTSRALLLIALWAGLRQLSGLRLFTLRGGLGQLAAALAKGLAPLLHTEALTVTPRAEGGYRVQAHRGGEALTFAADGVVVATTATAVPQLLPWLDHEQRAFFTAVAYSATVNLAVGTVGRLPQSIYGLLFPRRETPFLASATVQTAKDPSFAPPGRDAICLHLSGPATVALRQYDDATLARLMLADLRRLVPAYDPVPTLRFQRLDRCFEALPYFDVGHFGRLAHFAHGNIEPDRLVFAGDYLGGPFVEGAILSGEQAATRLLSRLKR
ncbi:MAG: FAD-dependent oxidoreductase [Chloroflexales bacterium]